MKAYKLPKEHCIEDKLHISLPNFSKQIIFSKDGYLYLRYKDTTIYRYLIDKLKDKIPQELFYNSEDSLRHIFKYNQIYLDISSNESSNHFSFYYFYKNDNSDTVFSKLYFNELLAAKKFSSILPTTRIWSKCELENFLYNTSDVTGKYIFFKGIIYAKSSNEQVSVKDNFIDLSDEAIIKIYNLDIKSANHWRALFTYEKRQTPAANIIEDVTNLNIVPRGYVLSDLSYPYLITLSDDGITICQFSIRLKLKNHFEVKMKKMLINESTIKELLSSLSLEEDYIDEFIRPKSKKTLKKSFYKRSQT